MPYVRLIATHPSDNEEHWVLQELDLVDADGHEHWKDVRTSEVHRDSNGLVTVLFRGEMLVQITSLTGGN